MLLLVPHRPVAAGQQGEVLDIDLTVGVEFGVSIVVGVSRFGAVSLPPEISFTPHFQIFNKHRIISIEIIQEQC